MRGQSTSALLVQNGHPMRVVAWPEPLGSPGRMFLAGCFGRHSPVPHRVWPAVREEALKIHDSGFSQRASRFDCFSMAKTRRYLSCGFPHQVREHGNILRRYSLS